MSKPWRPDGWRNYCGKGFKYGGWTCPDDEVIRRVCVGIYEAGADAMLETLRARAKNLTDGCGNINSIYRYVRIPDDEVKNEAQK